MLPQLFMSIYIVELVVITSRSFPHSWLITGFVTRVKRRVPLVEQEMSTLPEHLGTSPVFSRVRVARSLVFCVVLLDFLLSFCPFSFVMFVLRFAGSDYSIGIFKLFYSLYCSSYSQMKLSQLNLSMAIIEIFAIHDVKQPTINYSIQFHVWFMERK
jgi:hypothetical protein